MVGDGAVRESGTADETGAVPDAVALYDTHGDALFGFCVALGYRPRVAERVVREALTLAPERIRALRDPRRSRALLYALVRVVAERAAVERPGPGVVEQVLAAGGAGWSVPDRRRLAPLVPYALWAVDEDERIALDLSARHRLSDAEVADVLGVSERRTARLLAHGPVQFEQALAVYAVATHARRDCPELALLLPEAGAAVEAGLRQPLHLHVDSCPDCVALRPGPVEARALLAGGAAANAPYAIRMALRADGAAEPVDPVERGGFPKGTGRPRSRVPVVAACATAVALVLGTAVLLRPGAEHDTPIALSSAPLPEQPPALHPAEPPAASASVVPTTASAPSTTRAVPTSAPSTRAAAAKPTARTSRSAKPSTNAAAPLAGGPATLPRSGGTDAGNPAAPGTLSWSRSTVDLGAGGAAQTVRLTATGGPVTWSLAVSENDWLTVGSHAGTLANGQSISITISANPDRAPATTWAVTVSANPTGVSLTVTGGPASRGGPTNEFRQR
ncbi:BACON domain-containing protein [Embleya sp. NPDC055664]